MKIFFALIAVLLVSVSAQAQDSIVQNKMTPDQIRERILEQDKCQAEADLWKIEAEEWFKADHAETVGDKSDPSKDTTVDKMSFDGLHDRSHEMLMCFFLVPFMLDANGSLLYPPGSDAHDEKMYFYQDVGQDYDDMASYRINDFIDRHHLRQQFLDEDAAGLR